MTKNPILDELHAVRERLLAEAGGTLDALVDRLQAEEQQSDRPRFKPRCTRSRRSRAKRKWKIRRHRPVIGDVNLLHRCTINAKRHFGESVTVTLSIANFSPKGSQILRKNSSALAFSTSMLIR